MMQLDGLLKEGLSRHRAGDLVAAERLYEEILRHSPRNADACHYLGVIAHQRGEHQRAETLIGEALRYQPNQAYAHNNLGEALRAQGRFEEASVSYRQALELVPDYVEALNNLGLCLVELGDLEQGVACYQEVVRIEPGLVEARLNLANAYKEQGKLEEAAKTYAEVNETAALYVEAQLGLSAVQMQLGSQTKALSTVEALMERGAQGSRIYLRQADLRFEVGDVEGAIDSYRQAVAADPNSIDASVRLSQVLAQQGRWEQAESILSTLIDACPQAVEGYVELSQLFEMQEKTQAAIEICRRGLEVHTDNVLLWGRLGIALATEGSSDEGEAALRWVLKSHGADPAIHNALGIALGDQGRLDEGRHCFETALALKPDYAQAHNNLGSNLLMSGEMEQARACFDKALELEPDNAPALENLSSISGFGEDEEALLTRLSGLAGLESLPVAHRVSYHFTLGKMYEERGDWDNAFEHYAAGNRIHRKNVDYDRLIHEARVDRLIEVFNEDLISRGLDGASDSNVPIFIVGMPRSGTSLVEQILSSHSEVHGAGELSYFQRLQFRDLATDQIRHCEDYVDSLDREMVNTITRGYLDMLLSDVSDTGRVTDKMPANYIYLGLIAMIFPRVRIIYCRRDPLDTCVSIYFHNFKFLSFAWDLYDIGHQYAQHLRLMAHWMKVLPGRIFTIDYEELVNEQETRSRALIAHCGLDWDDRCLRFYDNERPVRTASHWQVRQPIYTGSIGRWKRYRDHLDELREALNVEPQ